MGRRPLRNPRRILNTEELNVLSAVLRATASEHNLPIRRYTEADGPNQLAHTQWAIPRSLLALGEVDVVEGDTQDSIRFRRPTINGEVAELTLELPHQLFHYRLELHPQWGWQL